MSKLINIAKQAFLNGYEHCGATVIGVDAKGIQKSEYVPQHYTLKLFIREKDGTEATASVGFAVVSESGTHFKCDTSPYNEYLNVISGDTVFSIPVTFDILEELPYGLNLLPLKSYSIEYLEEYISLRKKLKAENDLWYARQRVIELENAALGKNDSIF